MLNSTFFVFLKKTKQKVNNSDTFAVLNWDVV